MRRGAWRHILFANLTLAASLTAGCAGPAARSKQTAASRENTQQAEYAQNIPGDQNEQAFTSPPPRDLQHQGYAQGDYSPNNHQQQNTYQNTYQQDYYGGYDSGASSGYQSAVSPAPLRSGSGSGSGAGNSSVIERDLNTLRESEQRQEQTIRELRATPGVTPDELHDYEQKLQETRQRISVYDIALQQSSPAAGLSNAGVNRDKGERLLTEGALTGGALPNREKIRAMAPPGGESFPPRAEVRMPVNMTPDSFMNKQSSTRNLSQIAGAAGTMDSDPEVERVVYDPRRDGDFGLFSFSGSAGDAAPGPDSLSGPPDEPDPVKRKVLVPPGSIPPSTPPSAKLPPPSAAAPKPFAGAPVGRAQYQPRKTIEIPDDWTPPADLFSKSSAPEEVQAHPGLYSADGKAERSDWPDHKFQTGNAKKPENTAKQNTEAPSAPDRRPLRPEPARVQSRPQEKVEITIPPVTPKAPQATTKVPRATTKKRTEPAPVNKEETGADEVFVPDLFF